MMVAGGLLSGLRRAALRVFVREEGFYVIELPVDDDLNEHARLNPGTLRICDVSGAELWPEGAQQ